MRDEAETASAVALLMVFAHVLFLLDGLGPAFFLLAAQTTGRVRLTPSVRKDRVNYMRW